MILFVVSFTNILLASFVAPGDSLAAGAIAGIVVGLISGCCCLSMLLLILQTHFKIINSWLQY